MSELPWDLIWLGVLAAVASTFSILNGRQQRRPEPPSQSALYVYETPAANATVSYRVGSD